MLACDIVETFANHQYLSGNYTFQMICHNIEVYTSNNCKQMKDNLFHRFVLTKYKTKPAE